MVPAAAFAEAEEAVELDEAAIEAPIELEATQADNFSNGYIEAIGATGDKADPTVVYTDADKGKLAFPLGNNTAVAITVSKVMKEDRTSLTISGDDYEVAVYEGTEAAGAPLADGKIKAAGDYTVVIKAVKGTYAGGEVSATLSVSAAPFDANTAAYGLDENGAAKHSSGTPSAIAYTGDALSIGFGVKNGTDVDMLEEGKDYTVKYYAAGASESQATTSITDAGTYTAELTGLGKYANAKKQVAVTVNKYELVAGSVVVVKDVTTGANANGAPTAPDTIDGSAELAKHFKLDYTKSYTGPVPQGSAGSYSGVALALADANDSNVTIGTSPATASFKIVGAEAEFLYDGKAWAYGETLTINKANKDAFDPSKVSAKAGDLEFENNGATAGAGKVSVVGEFKAAGATSFSPWTYAAGNLSAAGEYKFTFTATADSENKGAGTKTLNVTVIEDVKDGDKSMYVTLDSKDVDYAKGLELTYGVNNLSEIAATVSGASGTPDIKWVDADGKDVASADLTATPAGEYTGTVTLAGYQIDNNTIKVTVKPDAVTGLQITNYNKDNTGTVVGGEVALPYAKGTKYDLVTGTTLGGKSVQLQFVANDAKTAAGEPDWGTTLDPAYKLKFELDGEDVTDKVTAGIEDKGTYTISVVIADEKDKNHEVTASSVQVTIAAPRTFTDVTEDKWYYEFVEEANDLGYMTGIGGTNLFQPLGKLTRAQAAQIIMNMAQGTAVDNSLAAENTQQTRDTGFSDVAGNKWYAPAIMWASSNGIVNGYAGTDKFGPENPVTREEFAVMLMRWEKAKGNSPAGDASKLDSYGDVAKISSWAKDAMAWAVSEEIMGNNKTLNPKDSIIRAEAAKMTTVAQPIKFTPGA